MDSDTLKQIRRNLAVILGDEAGELADAIRSLDALRAEADGQLGHYLAKRSYQKAWILLEGGDPEAGGCGK
jgi:NTP pyrophosphatase (non-canonical NTP hydrolase)